MNHADRHPALSGPGMMFLSAAIFGYFGFTMGLSHSNNAGQFILFFALLDWTLKGTAIGFVAGGVLTFIRPLSGNLIYSGIGVLSSLLFVAIALMDQLDGQNAAAISSIILLFFAAWNGFGSWQGLKTVLALRAMNSRSRETADFPASE